MLAVFCPGFSLKAWVRPGFARIVGHTPSLKRKKFETFCPFYFVCPKIIGAKVSHRQTVSQIFDTVYSWVGMGIFY